MSKGVSTGKTTKAPTKTAPVKPGKPDSRASASKMVNKMPKGKRTKISTDDIEV